MRSVRVTLFKVVLVPSPRGVRQRACNGPFNAPFLVRGLVFGGYIQKTVWLTNCSGT